MQNMLNETGSGSSFLSVPVPYPESWIHCGKLITMHRTHEILCLKLYDVTVYSRTIPHHCGTGNILCEDNVSLIPSFDSVHIKYE